MKKILPSQLEELEAARTLHGSGCAARVEKLLASLQGCEFADAESLIKFHDAVLFLRAFPQSRKVVTLADRLLGGILHSVKRLRNSEVGDLDLFDSEEFSGIAGTALIDNLTYEVARWLASRFPQELSVEWDIDDQARQMSGSLPQVLPLLGDDCFVEADTPYLRWLKTAAGGADKILPWLLRRVEALPLGLLEKTAWYDALRISVRWELGNSPVSRTHARRNPPQTYVHDTPLVRRNQVSLEAEFASPPLAVRKLARREAKDVLDLSREVLTVRYRELWGTTRGVATNLMRADVGRGVSIFLWGLPPERRLPLRAYHCGVTLKNGVPANYFEAISLFEWVEVGFNTFYAFRDGETAWIYSKLLHLLHQATGVSCFSVYPYQLGADNEEAIKSGAFWFYRKLGFRPGDAEALAITQREEVKIARKPGYRTAARTLRRLAEEHAFYETGHENDDGRRGLWDKFSTRTIGLAVQRRMAEKFGGDPVKMRQAAVTSLGKTLNVDPAKLSVAEQEAFADFAVVLAMAPDVSRFSREAKAALVEIIYAKTAPDESRYLRLLQKHSALRDVFLRLGSGQDRPGPSDIHRS